MAQLGSAGALGALGRRFESVAPIVIGLSNIKNQSHSIRGIFRGLCPNSNKESTDIFGIYAISC